VDSVVGRSCPSKDGTSNVVAAFQNAASVRNVSKLADTCRQIRNLCNEGVFKATEHSTIMTYLERRADKFRRNGRWCKEEMEEIIM
jgi:hypothetical protein